MTTTIKVTSHNYPARVIIYDTIQEHEDEVPTIRKTSEQIVTPEDGEQTFHCTTTRELAITDLEYDDPSVLEEKAKRAAALSRSEEEAANRGG